ncbi:MAG: hypothetical protein M3O46_03545, partial [Myxococcota bacterium]|nr:hypothetical protein [Myxococcota bacterium]
MSARVVRALDLGAGVGARVGKTGNAARCEGADAITGGETARGAALRCADSTGADEGAAASIAAASAAIGTSSGSSTPIGAGATCRRSPGPIDVTLGWDGTGAG